MKQTGNCSSCARGESMRVNTDILCSIRGVVSRDFRCSRYKRRPSVWSANPPSPTAEDNQKVKCIDCEFFLVPDSNREHNPSIGYCQLFTVRHYNGSSKNACSKFSKKADRNIS